MQRFVRSEHFDRRVDPGCRTRLPGRFRSSANSASEKMEDTVSDINPGSSRDDSVCLAIHREGSRQANDRFETDRSL